MSYKKILFLFSGLTIATGIFAGPVEDLEAEARRTYKESLITMLEICINHPETCERNEKCSILSKFFLPDVYNPGLLWVFAYSLDAQKAVEEISEEFYNKVAPKVINRKMHEKYFKDSLNRVVNSGREKRRREKGSK